MANIALLGCIVASILFRARAYRSDAETCSAQKHVAWAWATASKDVARLSSAPPGGGTTCAWREETTGRRVVSMADQHGDFPHMLEHLQRLGLVRQGVVKNESSWENMWSGGNAIFVQLGNVVNYGPDGKLMLRFLWDLQDQAAKATPPGEVVLLVGDHELMLLTGDVRYVATADFCQYSESQCDLTTDNWKFDSRHRSFLEAWDRNGTMGKEYRSRVKEGKIKVAHNIKDVVYVHAVLRPDILKYKRMLEGGSEETVEVGGGGEKTVEAVNKAFQKLLTMNMMELYAAEKVETSLAKEEEVPQRKPQHKFRLLGSSILRRMKAKATTVPGKAIHGHVTRGRNIDGYAPMIMKKYIHEQIVYPLLSGDGAMRTNIGQWESSTFCNAEMVARWLEMLKAKRMIVGHTAEESNVKAACEGRFLMTGTVMSQYTTNTLMTGYTEHELDENSRHNMAATEFYDDTPDNIWVIYAGRPEQCVKV